MRHLLVPDENSKITEVQEEAEIGIAEISDHSNNRRVEATATQETTVIVDRTETTRSSEINLIGTRKVAAQEANGVATIGETTTEIIKVRDFKRKLFRFTISPKLQDGATTNGINLSHTAVALTPKDRVMPTSNGWLITK